VTYYIADVGFEAADAFANDHDAIANGIEFTDLGDGRIRFDDEGLAWLRRLPADWDGSITGYDAGFLACDDVKVTMWVGGSPCDVTAEEEEES
jgi:hypothetical protein